jgi:hypothetical protein
MNNLSTAEFGTITQNEAHKLVCLCGNSDKDRGFMANNELGIPFYFGFRTTPAGLADLNFDSSVLYSCIECGRTYSEKKIFEENTAPVIATRDVDSEDFLNKLALYQYHLQIR